MSDVPFLSVIIPAFNEEQRIARSLQQTMNYLQQLQQISEVIVIDDGSSDRTAQIVSQIASVHDGLTLIRHSHNQGKGAAVRTGAFAAQGQYVLYMDADLATPLDHVAEFLAYATRHDCDLVIGSRDLARSEVQVHQPWLRRVMGRWFRWLIQGLMQGSVKDSQCGFKLFRVETTVSLFMQQRINGFAFDVELIWLALQSELRVSQLPVRWRNRIPSRVSLWIDAPRMMWDVLALQWRDALRRRWRVSAIKPL